MNGVGKTDMGIVRNNNEDSIFVSNSKIGQLNNLYIVSDGMGGHNGGEIASSKSIEFFLQFIENNINKNGDLLEYLSDALDYSNKQVYDISTSTRELNGMGATFTAATIENRKCFVAHVGDSRLYVINKENIFQITIDHTYVNELVKAGQITQEEAANHHLKNIITRAVGTDKACDIDSISYDIKKGDFILICSDGLSNKVSDKEMFDIISKKDELQEKSAKLVELANKNGGDDNISIVLIDTGVVKA